MGIYNVRLVEVSGGTDWNILRLGGSLSMSLIVVICGGLSAGAGVIDCGLEC